MWAARRAVKGHGRAPERVRHLHRPHGPLALERDHGGVVHEAIDEADRHHGVAQDLAPLLKLRLLVTMIARS